MTFTAPPVFARRVAVPLCWTTSDCPSMVATPLCTFTVNLSAAILETGSTAGNTPPGEPVFEVTHEWEACAMPEAEGMVISVLFCPECRETMDLDPPEGFVTTHPYDAP